MAHVTFEGKANFSDLRYALNSVLDGMAIATYPKGVTHNEQLMEPAQLRLVASRLKRLADDCERAAEYA